VWDLCFTTSKWSSPFGPFLVRGPFCSQESLSLIIFLFYLPTVEVFFSSTNTPARLLENGFTDEGKKAILENLVSFPLEFLGRSFHPDFGHSLDQCLLTWKILCSQLATEKGTVDLVLQHLETVSTGEFSRIVQYSLSAMEFLCGVVAIFVESQPEDTLYEFLRSKPLTSRKKWSRFDPLPSGPAQFTDFLSFFLFSTGDRPLCLLPSTSSSSPLEVFLSSQSPT